MKRLWNDWEFRLIAGKTRIDYDPEKEQKNRREKKYSLESAAYLLERRLLPIPQPNFVVKGPFSENGEVRYNLMTLDDDNKTIVFFVVTMRDKETVRIISFRKADKRERDEYREEVKKAVIAPPTNASS